MKQFLLFFAFFGLFTLPSLTAQVNHTVAAKAAAIDASIVKQVSRTTGQVEYFRKEVTATSGEAKLTRVQYCSRSGKFNPVVSYQKADCLKLKTDCRRTISSSSADNYSPRSQSACSPAQKAACTSANTKTTAIKKKSQAAAIVKKDKV